MVARQYGVGRDGRTPLTTAQLARKTVVGLALALKRTQTRTDTTTKDGHHE